MARSVLRLGTWVKDREREVEEGCAGEMVRDGEGKYSEEGCCARSRWHCG